MTAAIQSLDFQLANALFLSVLLLSQLFSGTFENNCCWASAIYIYIQRVFDAEVLYHRIEIHFQLSR